METKIKELAKLINSLTDENFNMAPNEEPFDDDPYHYMKAGDTSDEIASLANCCLISQAHPNFENMKQLRELCPRIVTIRRGDYDSYGWLTGVIVLEDDKVIVFG